MSEDTGATINLSRLALVEGAAARIDRAVEIEPLILAGQTYRLHPEPLEVRLDVARALSGYDLRLVLEVELTGACWRCLGDAATPVDLDIHEFAGLDADDEDLASDYVEGDVLRLGEWVRDAISEAVPPTILCRPDCAGLCPSCGADLNTTTCDCAGPEPDPRWAGLEEIARRLDAGSE